MSQKSQEEPERFASITSSLKRLTEKYRASASAIDDLIDLMEDEDTLDVTTSGENFETLSIIVKNLNFFKLDDIVNEFGKIVIERGNDLYPYKITVQLKI